MSLDMAAAAAAVKQVKVLTIHGTGGVAAGHSKTIRRRLAL